MKRHVFFSILILTSIQVIGQNIGINDTGSTPNAKAILDVDVSTNDKGVLLPRLTTTQRTAMTLGASEEGMLLYDETTNSFWVWSGSAWSEMTSGGWKLDGNSGTSSGTNFIGTSDNVDLDFRANNTVYVRLTANGRLETVNTGNSVFVGESAGENDDLTNNQNVFIGYRTGRATTTGTLNLAMGSQAMLSNTSGYRNTAVGSDALNANLNGFRNTALGAQSLKANTTGSYNIAAGYNALASNTEGNNSVAIGNHALFSTSTMSSSLAVGDSALFANTSGSNNVAIGSLALQSNTTGYYNTALGKESLKSNTVGNNNLAFGYKALSSNTTGDNLVAIGNHALFSATTSSGLIAIGDSALFSNSYGYDNVAISPFGLKNNTTGKGNLAVGSHALLSNIVGSYNVALGASALRNSTTSSNVAIGFETLMNQTSGAKNVAIGYKVLEDLSTGDRNVACGYFSMNKNTSGEKNVAFGYYAGYRCRGSGNVFLGHSAGLHETGSNNLYIDNSNTTTPLIKGDFDLDSVFIHGDLLVRDDLMPLTDETGNLGSSSKRWRVLYSRFGVVQTSDIRFKKNIKNLQYGLLDVMSLRPVSYDWKNDSTASRKIGFIAQELEKVIPEVVHTGDDSLQTKGVNYAELVSVLVKAVQELKGELEATSSKTNTLEKENLKFKSEIEGLQEQVERLQFRTDEVKL